MITEDVSHRGTTSPVHSRQGTPEEHVAPAWAVLEVMADETSPLVDVLSVHATESKAAQFAEWVRASMPTPSASYITIRPVRTIL